MEKGLNGWVSLVVRSRGLRGGRAHTRGKQVHIYMESDALVGLVDGIFDCECGKKRWIMGGLEGLANECVGGRLGVLQPGASEHAHGRPSRACGSVYTYGKGLGACVAVVRAFWVRHRQSGLDEGRDPAREKARRSRLAAGGGVDSTSAQGTKAMFFPRARLQPK